MRPPSINPVAPGEGERRAQRGFQHQYRIAASLAYAALENDDLLWIGIADRNAGSADDLVLGLRDRIIGHQIRSSKYPEPFSVGSSLIGPNGLLPGLVSGWKRLRNNDPRPAVEIQLITNNYPSTRDRLIDGPENHSAAFLSELACHAQRPLNDWRDTEWQPVIDAMAKQSELGPDEFAEFLRSLRIVSGQSAEFSRACQHPPAAARLVDDLERVISTLVTDRQDRDRWSKTELLQRLGWKDWRKLHRRHEFPIGKYIQRNLATEKALRQTLRQSHRGYVALIGPPGTGKSTLLQSTLATRGSIRIVRYVAYVPGAAQGLGRGEASDFLDDLITQLKRGGLTGTRYHDGSLQERREQFAGLLAEAHKRYEKSQTKTVIVIDGLDHVAREERPERSFLTELPLPQSLPAGVIVVLGTQRLDLPDMPPAVREQAQQIRIVALSRPATRRMVRALEPDPDLSSARVFELCHGHPLATWYLVQAWRRADALRRAQLLNGEFLFSGDIETIYASAWRDIESDAEVRDVVDCVAHAEGVIEPALLAQATHERAVERTLIAAGHLLKVAPAGWTTFHNSFKQFVLMRARTRFGRPDPERSTGIYSRLAGLAERAGTSSAQRWLDLRYLARAERYPEVLARAQPGYFRAQLAQGRSAAAIARDLSFALQAAKVRGRALDVFRLLLIDDEIRERSQCLKSAPNLAAALQVTGQTEPAKRYAKHHARHGRTPDERHRAIEIAGTLWSPQKVFGRCDPLGRVLTGRKPDIPDFPMSASDLCASAKLAVRWFEPDAVIKAIEHAAKQKYESWFVQDKTDPAKLTAACALMSLRPAQDPYTVADQFVITNLDLARFLIHAASVAVEPSVTLKVIRHATTLPHFVNAADTDRRQAALIAARAGELQLARSIFSGLALPMLVLGDKIMAAVSFIHETLADAELAGRLKQPRPLRKTISPISLTTQARQAGTAIARCGAPAAADELTRAIQDSFAYLHTLTADSSNETFSVDQLRIAAPIVTEALIRAAASCGRTVLDAVTTACDCHLQTPPNIYADTVHFRRTIIMQLYRHNGDRGGASRRLEQLIPHIHASRAFLQVDAMATLAKDLAQVGNMAAAQQLLARVSDQTLDAFDLFDNLNAEAIWPQLLRRANQQHPAGGERRIRLMVSLFAGLTTLNSDPRLRIVAADILIEAAHVDARIGFAVWRALVRQNSIDGNIGGSLILASVVQRHPELARACVAAWPCSAVAAHEGSDGYKRADPFIDVTIRSARDEDAASLIGTLLAKIQSIRSPHQEQIFLTRLAKAASARNMLSRDLQNALHRAGGQETAWEHAASRSGGFGTSPQGSQHFAPVVQAMSAGNMDAARRLLDECMHTTDLIPGWTSTPSSCYKAIYFTLKRALDGNAVAEAARADLCQELMTKADRAQIVLRDFSRGTSDVFSAIDPAPDWPAMWELFAERFAATREHPARQAFEESGADLTDEKMIGALKRSLLFYNARRHLRMIGDFMSSTTRAQTKPAGS